MHRNSISHDPDRSALRRAFLKDQGYGDWQVLQLGSDASFRRYFRLVRGEESLILMDAPPPEENAGRYQLLAEHLKECGLRAPSIFARDIEQGFLILEDFGDRTFKRLLDEGEDPRMLYSMAIDTLIQLHRSDRALKVKVAPYSREVLDGEARIFIEWYVSAGSGGALAKTAVERFFEAWDAVWTSLPPSRPALVLGDYHVDNLMQIGNGIGINHCGVLDFQDATVGPQCFEVMSLLEDARREVSRELTGSMIDRYKKTMDDGLDQFFDQWYSAMAVHRHMRVLGVFVRLWRRDRKPGYLAHIPHVVGLLESHRRVPHLDSIFDWLDEYVPDLRQAANLESCTK